MYPSREHIQASQQEASSRSKVYSEGEEHGRNATRAVRPSRPRTSIRTFLQPPPLPRTRRASTMKQSAESACRTSKKFGLRRIAGTQTMSRRLRPRSRRTRKMLLLQRTMTSLLRSCEANEHGLEMQSAALMRLKMFMAESRVRRFTIIIINIIMATATSSCAVQP